MNDTDIITYVINLDSSTDRLASVQKNLAEANVDFIRVSAFDGRFLDMNAVDFYDDEKTIKRFGRSLNSGEIGCYKSHVDCLQRFLASDAKYAMVLEDDINIAPDILAFISKAISFLNDNEPDWYVIQPGIIRLPTHTHLCKLDNKQSLYAVHRFRYGAYGLLWSRKGAQTVLDQAYPIEIPIDELFAYIMMHNLRANFAIYPPLITHRDVKSDIDSGLVSREGVYKIENYRHFQKKEYYYNGLKAFRHKVIFQMKKYLKQ